MAKYKTGDYVRVQSYDKSSYRGKILCHSETARGVYYLVEIHPSGLPRCNPGGCNAVAEKNVIRVIESTPWDYDNREYHYRDCKCPKRNHLQLPTA